jgi:tRNA threonylcarbamoyladenosine biosynthesis protein TsaB
MLAALEVSTRISSVALLDPVTGEELGELALSSEVESSSTLIPGLDEILRTKGLGPKNLTAVAVAVGPGSFTGIRVGIATAQGLCMSSKLPAYGISTLDGLAENLRAAGLTGEALCLVDAMRGECFVGHYSIQKEGFSELSAPSIVAVDKLGLIPRGKVLAAGPGAMRYEKEIRGSLASQVSLAPPHLHSPSAMSVGRLACRQWKAGKKPGFEQLTPFYLRPPSVEEKRPGKGFS